MQRKQGMQESETQKEEMRQQQRMKVMTAMTEKIQAKGGMDANNSWWVSEFPAADCKMRGSTQDGKTQCCDGGGGASNNGPSYDQKC